MIEFIGAYIKTIVSFILITALVEIISPDKYKKYLKFVMGLILTVTILQPVIHILGFSTEEISASTNKFFENAYSNESSNENNNKFNEYTEESLFEEIYKDELEKNISEDTKGAEVLVEINTEEENYGEILKINIYLEEGNVENLELKKEISNKYGVEEDNVNYIYK